MAKILLAEDNNFVRMQIAKYLQDDGHEVVEEINGEAAYKAMDTSFDLAIVDVRMEPMSGFEFITAIRGDEMEIPVVLITGDQNPDMLSHASALGVFAVLMKPVQKERLLKTVERAARI